MIDILQAAELHSVYFALDGQPAAHAGRPFFTCKVTAKQEQKQEKECFLSNKSKAVGAS